MFSIRDRFRILSILLAVLLFVTAVLKLHLLLTDPFVDIKTGSSPAILWLAVVLETAVAWLIFTAVGDELKWLVLIVFFSALTAFSIFNVASGKSDCGCAGSISLHPLWFLAINILAVGLLWLNRIQLSSRKIVDLQDSSSNSLGHITAFLVVGLVFVVMQTDIAQRMANRVFSFGSSNTRIQATPVKLGILPWSEELVECEISLTNDSGRPTRVIGLSKSCSCVFLADIVHEEIVTAGVKKVKVKVRPNREGRFHQRVLFYLDSPQQYVVAADIFAMILEKR